VDGSWCIARESSSRSFMHCEGSSFLPADIDGTLHNREES